MPNAIKYNVSAETLSLKKGNFYIGTGDVGKGDTASTGFYNGITPPSGGFTIYLNKVSGGPSIYTVTTEAQLTGLTSTIAGQTLTTSGACLNWFATQTDKMIFNIDCPTTVTNGLFICLDSGFIPSYQTSGTTWYNLSSGGNNGTLTNGTTYSSVDGGSMVFDGVDDYVALGNNSSFTTITSMTICAWINGAVYRTNVGGWNRIIYNSGFNFYVSQKVLFFGTSGISRTSNQTLTENTWYHVAVTFNVSTNSLIFYLNGAQVQTQTITNATISSNSNTNISHGDSPYGDSFNGKINVVQVYNRVLSASEILQNYNATKSRFGL